MTRAIGTPPENPPEGTIILHPVVFDEMNITSLETLDLRPILQGPIILPIPVEALPKGYATELAGNEFSPSITPIPTEIPMTTLSQIPSKEDLVDAGMGDLFDLERLDQPV